MHFKDYVNLTKANVRKLAEYYEASQHLGWRRTMESEIKSIKKEKELIELRIGKNLITSKWVFKVKKIASGEVDKLEVQLLVRGFQQYRGLDFDETFTPTVK